MEKETSLAQGKIRALIQDSKKIRKERGDDFLEVKVTPPSVVQVSESNLDFKEKYKTTREGHSRLRGLISNFDREILKEIEPTPNESKKRSSYVQVYLSNSKVEDFLRDEMLKKESKWKLRKNAGLGSLIQKFIEDYRQMKVRETLQFRRIDKIITEFRKLLVEFKKLSAMPDEYKKTEEIKIKMSELSNNLREFIILLEFDDIELKNEFGDDTYKWIDFVIKWKLYV